MIETLIGIGIGVNILATIGGIAYGYGKINTKVKMLCREIIWCRDNTSDLQTRLARIEGAIGSMGCGESDDIEIGKVEEKWLNL